MSIKIKLKTKYNVIKIDNYYIESSSNLSNIKQQIKKAMKTKPNFIEDAKMESEVIINSNLIEFNISMISLLLSFAAFYLSIFEPIQAQILNILPYYFYDLFNICILEKFFTT